MILGVNADRPIGEHHDRLRLPRRWLLFCVFMLTGGNLLIPRELLLLIILLLSVTYFGAINFKVNTRKMIAYGWVFTVMAFAFVMAQDPDVFTNIIRVANFFVGFLLLRIYGGPWGGGQLMGDLKSLVGPMVYQAILTVILAAVVPGIFLSISYNGTFFQSFFGLLNYHETIIGASVLVRPNGFFFEPGVFQIYLNILIFLYFVDEAPMWRIGLAALAVFLTQSTTGIVIASLQIWYFALVPLFLKGRFLRKLFILAVVAGISVPIYSTVYQNIQSKLVGQFSGSGAARAYDLQSGLLIIQAHPLAGIGFNYNVYLDESIRLNPDTAMLSVASEDGRLSSNGLLLTLYSVGLPLGLIYLLAIFRQSLLPHRGLFGLILLLSLLTETLSFTPFFALFAFNGMYLGRQFRVTPKHASAYTPLSIADL